MFAFFFSILNAANETTQSLANTGIQNIIAKYSQFFVMIFFVLIFYFLLIRPQNKQRQKLAEMINNIQIGDKVITKGGIFATISTVKTNSFEVELLDGTKIEILKHAVISLVNDNSEQQ